LVSQEYPKEERMKTHHFLLSVIVFTLLATPLVAARAAAPSGAMKIRFTNGDSIDVPRWSFMYTYGESNEPPKPGVYVLKKTVSKDLFVHLMRVHNVDPAGQIGDIQVPVHRLRKIVFVRRPIAAVTHDGKPIIGIYVQIHIEDGSTLTTSYLAPAEALLSKAKYVFDGRISLQIWGSEVEVRKNDPVEIYLMGNLEYPENRLIKEIEFMQ
jgi:hypothetical protein